jgi:uncharacterized protein DUF397
MDLSDARWHKSPPASSGGWVEVAFVNGRVVLRSSRDPDGPVLEFTPFEWQAFVGGVRLARSSVSPREGEP